MPGNAFAQAKARDSKEQRQKQKTCQLVSTKGDSSEVPFNEASQSPKSPVTLLEMLNDGPPGELTIAKARSPQKSIDASPSKRSVTDPEKYMYAHKSALPEPLFHPHPVVNILSKLTSRKSSLSKDNLETPPKVPEKEIVPPQKYVNVHPSNAPTSTPAQGQERDKQDQSSERSRSSSYSSQASSHSNRQVDPVKTIREAHDTRYAFAPSSNLSHQTPMTPISRYVESTEYPDDIVLGPTSVGPTRDGKYGRMKNTEFIEQSRIPSLSGSIVGGRSFYAPTIWLGPDGRIYSGPLLQPLTYQPTQTEISQDCSGIRTKDIPSFNGTPSSSSGSIQTPAVYAVAGGGAWEQLQVRFPTTLPPFDGRYYPHLSTSSTASEPLPPHIHKPSTSIKSSVIPENGKKTASAIYIVC